MPITAVGPLVRSLSVPTHKLLVPVTYVLGIGGTDELTGSVD
jgi:hypothetical protein